MNRENESVEGPSQESLQKRGNYWEVTYKEGLEPLGSWILTRKDHLATETGKTKVTVTTERDGTRAINLAKKQFETCDFNHFTLDDSSFSDCAFRDCRFVKANFTNVKFSRCVFVSCHFLYARFTECQFISCTFEMVSASAELLQFQKTSISASSFMHSLVTNISALPRGTTEQYQKHRLLASKAKIAGGILLSVRDEPDLDQLFDANKCFEIAMWRKRVAEASWILQSDQVLSKRPLLYRFTVKPVNQLTFAIIRAAGFLTDWGRSPAKSVWFLAGTIIAFTAIYRLSFNIDVRSAILRALDCTFVFGYTRYNVKAPPAAVDWAMFANALGGFCWYALLIPALSRRLFR